MTSPGTAAPRQRTVVQSAEVQLKDRREVLPVSRSFLHVFRQM